MSENDLVSNSAMMTTIIKGKIASFIGWLVASSFGIFVVFGIFLPMKEDKTPGLVFCIFFLVIGILFIVYGRNIKYKIKRFKSYIPIILNENEINFENIAITVSQPVNLVLTDLQNMIDRKILVGAYLDMKTQQIVFQDWPNNRPVQVIQNNMQTNIEDLTCRSCGANNQVTNGYVGECQFCGSAIGTK